MKTHNFKLMLLAIALGTTIPVIAQANSSVAAPTVTLTPSATTIAYNGNVTLSWTSSNANSCTGSNGSQSEALSTSGSVTQSGLTSAKTYTLSCSGAGGTTSKSVTVAVNAPAPTVSLTSSAASIAYNGNVTLNWTSTNATSCTATGGWTGTQASSGSVTQTGLTGPTTYNLSCTGTGGTASQSASVAVSAPPAPTVALTASANSIAYNGNVTLTWSSTNATSCTATGGWTGTEATSGTATETGLTTATTYNLSCTGVGGTTSQSAVVAVSAPPAPTVALTASSTSIAYGGNVTLNWSTTNANTCTGSNGSQSESLPTSGSVTQSGLTSSTTFSLSCTGTGGNLSKSVTVAVAPKAVPVTAAAPVAPVTPAPTVTLTASSPTIAYNGNVTLSWSSTNATSCTATGGWTGAQTTSGSVSETGLTASTSYILSCTGAGGAASQTAAVTVSPAVPTVTLSAAATSVASGNSTTLTWSSTNATSCTATGGWTGSEPTSGSLVTAKLTATTIYNLSCTGAGGTVAQSATVAVAAATANNALAGNYMGVNLNWVNDSSWQDQVFVDLVKQSRGFATATYPWDPTNHPAPVDANGWPTSDFGDVFASFPADPLGQSPTALYPSYYGTYNVVFNGIAHIGFLDNYQADQVINQVYNAATNTTTAQLVIGPNSAGLQVVFTNTQRTASSAVNTGITNLKLLRQGYAVGTTQVFSNEFLNAISPFSALRFVCFLNANGNPVTTWAGRTPASQPSQADPRGVAWEYVIEMANASGKDIWINIPEGVDLTDTTSSNYITQLANLMKATLDPNIHVYIEYSNELWNFGYGFSQTQANLASAVADLASGADPTLNYDNNNNEYTQSAYRVAHQVVRISQLFAAVYGPSAINNTIRPVLMAQAANPYSAQIELAYIKANFGAPSQYIYAIGSAPYNNAPNAYTDVNSLFASYQAGMNAVLPMFSGASPYVAGGKTQATYQSLANYYGVQNFSYEGGPDTPDSPNYSATITEQANSDPRMNQLVQAYLSDSIACGNKLFMYYQLSGPTSDSYAIYNDLSVPTQKSAAIEAVSNTTVSSLGACSSSVNSSFVLQ